ncbi:hypothetical protein ACH44C_09845 [Streptomyces purpureus]|uniref:DUF7144 family membrane protein n=1 Tax=Streptomyces purpureus TaxID=1951 RepID=UPI003787693C
MTQNTAPSPPPGAPGPSPATTGWAAGGTLFAGVLMTVVGILDVIQGIAAIAKDDVYTRIGDYVFAFNLTAWGVIHLVLGIVIAVAGWGILTGKEWGRALGIALAALHIVEQFLWLPYHPVWAIFAMALSVFVIWALATDTTFTDHTRDATATSAPRGRPPTPGTYPGPKT